MPLHSSHDPVAIALAEDLGSGDLTSEFFVERRPAHARLFCKETAVLAGVATAAEVFRRVDPAAKVQILRPDGSLLKPGESVLKVEATLPSLLSSERVALNFLQHLSGIATLTRQFVDAIAGTKARILDTRKTVPGLRHLEKAAVVAGGGVNHRMGLDDMVMVKDNHLASGTTLPQLQEAIHRFHRSHPSLQVVLEADTLDQVRSFLTLEGVSIVLLDNMSLDQLREAVQMNSGKLQLEASGGVSLETVAAIASTGVDRISVGALTHSARAIDFSMELA